MFRALSNQRGEFVPGTVVASGVEGLDLAMKMLFVLFQGRRCSSQASKGALPPPRPGLRDKALQKPWGTCQPSFPGGAGLKEALTLLFTAFKGRTVKSWPPNAHIMWEKVLGRK